MVSNAETPRARQLGAELRQLRGKMPTRKLGELVGRSGSHISRWETGKLVPSEADIGGVLAVLGAPASERERLLELARDAADPNWIAPGVDRQLAALTEYERTARTIIDVEPQLVPGLLQTAAYARAVLIAHGATSGEADQRTMMRLGRQHILTGSHPRTLVALIGEYALRYPLCGREVMAEQLRHLEKMARLDNVDLRILPMSRPAAPALTGAWVVIEFERSKPILHLEHYSSSATITDARTVAKYQEGVDTLLNEVAMSPADSIGLIAEIAEMEMG